MESSDVIRDGGQFSLGEGDVLPEGGKLDHPHSEMSEGDETEMAERPKKRRGKANPLEVELDLSGEYPRGICRDLV